MEFGKAATSVETKRVLQKWGEPRYERHGARCMAGLRRHSHALRRGVPNGTGDDVPNAVVSPPEGEIRDRGVGFLLCLFRPGHRDRRFQALRRERENQISRTGESPENQIPLGSPSEEAPGGGVSSPPPTVPSSPVGESLRPGRMGAGADC